MTGPRETVSIVAHDLNVIRGKPSENKKGLGETQKSPFPLGPVINLLLKIWIALPSARTVKALLSFICLSKLNFEITIFSF